MAIEAPVHARPTISLIAEDLPPHGAKLFIGDTDAARDLTMLRRHGIATVINCAVNLDINYVGEPAHPGSDTLLAAGTGPVRTYKLGLIDGPGNPATMLMAGYYLMSGALRQEFPEKPSYPRRERGNVLVHCRGGRSRSVALAALYLHIELPGRFPTMDATIAHIRERRELHPDEWFETPNARLLDAAVRSAGWIKQISAEAG